MGYTLEQLASDIKEALQAGSAGDGRPNSDCNSLKSSA